MNASHWWSYCRPCDGCTLQDTPDAVAAQTGLSRHRGREKQSGCFRRRTHQHNPNKVATRTAQCGHTRQPLESTPQDAEHPGRRNGTSVKVRGATAIRPQRHRARCAAASSCHVVNKKEHYFIATERIQRHIFLVSQPRYERRRRPNIGPRCVAVASASTVDRLHMDCCRCCKSRRRIDNAKKLLSEKRDSCAAVDGYIHRQGLHHGTTSDTTSRHAVSTSLAVSSHRRWRPCQTLEPLVMGSWRARRCLSNVCASNKPLFWTSSNAQSRPYTGAMSSAPSGMEPRGAHSRRNRESHQTDET